MLLETQNIFIKAISRLNFSDFFCFFFNVALNPAGIFIIFTHIFFIFFFNFFYRFGGNYELEVVSKHKLRQPVAAVWKRTRLFSHHALHVCTAAARSVLTCNQENVNIATHAACTCERRRGSGGGVVVEVQVDPCGVSFQVFPP